MNDPVSRPAHYTAGPSVPEDLATDQMMAANLSALLIKECGLHSPGSSAHDLLQRAAAMLVNYGLPAHSATPPAPEMGEVEELVAALEQDADRGEGFYDLSNTTAEQFTRAAELLQQQQHLLGLACAELDRLGAFSAAPAPAVAPVAVSERPWERPGWLDREGRCWFLSLRFFTWSLESPPVALTRGIGRCFSLPAHAIPLPQAGEVEA